MSHTRFSGRTAAEAAIRACEELGTTRSELRYDVVEDEGEGLARRVTIEVKNAAKLAPEPPAPARGPAPAADEGESFDDDDEPPRRDEIPNEAPRSSGHSRGGRGGQQRGRDRAAPRRDAAPPSEGQGDRGGNRRRRGRGGQGQNRNERNDRPERSAPPRGESRRGASESARRPAGPGLDTLLEMREAPADVAPLPAIEGTSARSKSAVEVVEALVKHMDLDVNAALVREDDSEIHVHITGKDEKKAIGQRGEVLLSLQFLANRLLGRAEQEDEADQVLVLDAGGHRQRRHAAIDSLAKALAERAVAEGKAVRLSPMSAHDRRIFHVALKEVEDVVTQSEGDGLLRNLLIVPAVFVR